MFGHSRTRLNKIGETGALTAPTKSYHLFVVTITRNLKNEAGAEAEDHKEFETSHEYTEIIQKQ